MSVAGGQPVAVVDFDHDAIAAACPGFGDDAAPGGANGGTIGIAQVDTRFLDPTDQRGPVLHLLVTGRAVNDSLFVILPACQFALIQNDDG